MVILVGLVVAVLQVRWAARSTQGPVQWWRVSRPLPRVQRYASDLAIAAFVLSGAFTLEQGRP
jgi:hypothetical protein